MRVVIAEDAVLLRAGQSRLLDEAGETVVAAATGVAPGRRRREGGWLAAGLVVAVLTVAFGAWDVVGALWRQPIQFQRSWAGPVRTVDLEISDGSVTLVGARRRPVPATHFASGRAGSRR